MTTNELLTAMHGRRELLALANHTGWKVETYADGSVSITKPGRLIRLTFTKANPDRVKTAEWDTRRVRGGIAVSAVAHELRTTR